MVADHATGGVRRAAQLQLTATLLFLSPGKPLTHTDV
jgi:hypothetical protein